MINITITFSLIENDQIITKKFDVQNNESISLFDLCTHLDSNNLMGKKFFKKHLKDKNLTWLCNGLKIHNKKYKIKLIENGDNLSIISPIGGG